MLDNSSFLSVILPPWYHRQDLPARKAFLEHAREEHLTGQRPLVQGYLRALLGAQREGTTLTKPLYPLLIKYIALSEQELFSHLLTYAHCPPLMGWKPPALALEQAHVEKILYWGPKSIRHVFCLSTQAPLSYRAPFWLVFSKACSGNTGSLALASEAV